MMDDRVEHTNTIYIDNAPAVGGNIFTSLMHVSAQATTCSTYCGPDTFTGAPPLLLALALLVLELVLLPLLLVLVLFSAQRYCTPCVRIIN